MCIRDRHKHAIDYSDAIVQASSNIQKQVLDYIKSTEKPFMEYPGKENYIDVYQEFYKQFIEEVALI